MLLLFRAPVSALCKLRVSPVKNIPGCVCVSSHLQSEQLAGVYSIFLNGDGGLRRGGSWQPEYRHPIQSVWRPHLALKAWAEAGGRRGWAGWILQMDGRRRGRDNLCLKVAFVCSRASITILYFHMSFESLFSNSRLRPLERPSADSRGAARSVRGHKAQPGEPLWLHSHRWAHRGVWYTS